MNIIDIRDKLKTNPSKNKWRKRKATNNIAVHHSQVDGQTAYNYNNWHVDNNDWYRISYHYVIEVDGTVYKCNDVNDYTYHVGNSNRDTIGICISGNLDKHNMTSDQMDSLITLLTITTLDNDLHHYDIKGHREFPLSKKHRRKTCPGTTVDMESIRKDVAQSLCEVYSDKIWAIEQKITRLEEE